MNERLKSLREALGLSQKEMALRLGISLRSLQNYEGGLREIPSKVIARCYEQLSANPTWLLAGDGPMFLQKETPFPPPPSSEAEVKGFPIHTLKRAKFFWQKAHEIVFQGEKVTMIPFEGLIEGQDLLEAYVRQEYTDEELWEKMVRILEEWREKLERDVAAMEEEERKRGG